MRVAIIDDCTTILVTTDLKLRKMGAILLWDTVEKFKDADSFLANLKNDVNTYDIIIVDHDLGVNQMRGYELISHIQKQGYRNKAVLFTSDDSLGMHVKMFFTWHVDYVVKDSGKKMSENHFSQLANAIVDARTSSIAKLQKNKQFTL